MKATLELINRMQADGVISKYAVGGAVGATFYLEPAATLDVDIFILFPATRDSALLSLTSIYDYLIARGGRPEGAHIVVGEWPVQFLPASDALDSEAITEAVRAEVEGVRTWVMTAEHLVAIALRTGRAKDYARIVQFTEQGAVNTGRLNEILSRHGLTQRWEQFERKYILG